jgi:hypothetical protein
LEAFALPTISIEYINRNGIISNCRLNIEVTNCV